MTTDFQHNGPITQDRAERAAEWLVHHAAEIAIAKGRRDNAEYLIGVARSMAFEATEGTVAAREHAAKTSQKYLDAVEEYTSALVAHETLLGTRRAAETVIDVWRSINSNLRNAP